MRVALVANFCPHYRRPLFSELSRRMDLTLILTSRGNEWYWQGERPLDTGEVPSVHASTPARVSRELRTGAYDAIVSQLTGRAVLMSVFWTSRRLSIPFVLWVGIWEHPRTLVHRLSRPIVRRLYESADSIVTYGTHVSDYVSRESGRTGGIFVAHQAVENERFRARMPQSEINVIRERFKLGGCPTFAFLGRLTEEKGLDYLVDASAKVTKPHRLLIAGTGPLFEATKTRITALGIDDQVILVGNVEQHEVPALLRASDVLVLPSVSTRRSREAWGVVVNEAMNCGLPVIATDAVGAAAGGLVVDGETGLVVPERDVNALAGALDELAGNEARRRAMGVKASDRVLDWNFVAAADGFEAALAAATKT